MEYSDKTQFGRRLFDFSAVRLPVVFFFFFRPSSTYHTVDALLMDHGLTKL